MVQERRALLMDLLRRFFTEKGCREVASSRGLDLVFENGRRRIGVKLLFYSADPLRDQKAVRSSIYRFLREKPCDEVYFAVEEIRYSHIPRAEEFKESGVGLLRVHEGRVEVAIPAVPFDRNEAGQPPARRAQAFGSESVEGRMPLAEDALIRELERRVKELVEQKLAEYLSKGSLQAGVAWGVEQGRQALSLQQESSAEARSDSPVAADSAFPDIEFLKGNPWLEALMRRGRE